MSNFQVAPQHAHVILPGVGLVQGGRVLIGEMYRKYVNLGLLVEIPSPAPGEATTALETPAGKALEQTSTKEDKTLLTEVSTRVSTKPKGRK
jgi:hypothetical protein